MDRTAPEAMLDSMAQTTHTAAAIVGMATHASGTAEQGRQWPPGQIRRLLGGIVAP